MTRVVYQKNAGGEGVYGQATPNVGPFAPSIIAHTAIIKIS